MYPSYNIIANTLKPTMSSTCRINITKFIIDYTFY